MDSDGKLFPDPQSRPHLGSALFASSSGLLFGYDLGLVQGAIHSIKESLELSNTMIDLIVAAAKVGAVFGPFLAGWLMSKLGRRFGMVSGAFFFFIGPIVMAMSQESAGGARHAPGEVSQRKGHSKKKKEEPMMWCHRVSWLETPWPRSHPLLPSPSLPLLVSAAAGFWLDWA